MDIYDVLPFRPLIIIDSTSYNVISNEKIKELNFKAVDYFQKILKDYDIETVYITPEDYFTPMDIKKYRINTAFSDHIKKEKIRIYSNQVICINIFFGDNRHYWDKSGNDVKLYCDESSLSMAIAYNIKESLDVKQMTKKAYEEIIPSMLEVEIGYNEECDCNYTYIIDVIIEAYLKELGFTKEEIIFNKENKSMIEKLNYLEGRVKALEARINKIKGRPGE